MPTIKSPKTPITKSKPKIDKETLKQLSLEEHVEGQVIVHCSCTSFLNNDKIRIWKSTFLFDTESDHQSKLVSSENIALYPKWTKIAAGQTHNFTLIFTGLAKSCKRFDLIECIPELGGFEVMNIKRNKKDIYFLRIS